jgi:hypothetical protein
VLEPLCSLARSEDVELEIQRYAVLAIANLASAADNHDAFIEEGMLPLLISLSMASDAEVRFISSLSIFVLQNSICHPMGSILRHFPQITLSDAITIFPDFHPMVSSVDQLCKFSFNMLLKSSFKDGYVNFHLIYVYLSLTKDL